MRRFWRNPLSLTGSIILFLLLLLAVLAPFLAPPNYPDPYSIPRRGFAASPQPPGPGIPWGTAEGGYDLYYGVVWGARFAFRLGLEVVLGILVVGIVVGGLAGYFGGIVDEFLMRVADVFFAFPPLVLAMALAAVLGPGPETIVPVLIVVGWPAYARLVRSDVLALREELYVEAARALGASHFRILFRHILPHAIYPALVMASLDFGVVVLAAAALSFLGLGAPRGFADWGQLIQMSRHWLIGPPGEPFRYWFAAVIPGAFLFLFALGWNLLGDAFRDILDPRLRRR